MELTATISQVPSLTGKPLASSPKFFPNKAIRNTNDIAPFSHLSEGEVILINNAAWVVATQAERSVFLGHNPVC